MSGTPSLEYGLKIKKSNIRYHDQEAEIFEKRHPEGSSLYERYNVLKNISFIIKNSSLKSICVDLGCGTGFILYYELPHYSSVVALDISSSMIKVVKKNFSKYNNLNLIIGDAELLPFREKMFDLASISSVLHHLPFPYRSLTETSNILKSNGFLFISREPNHIRYRKYFDFIDFVFIMRINKLLTRLTNIERRYEHFFIEGFDSNLVDVHYSLGLDSSNIAEFLKLNLFNIIFTYSYHWIYPNSNQDLFQRLLVKSNFIIERLPLSKKYGRYINILAKKNSQCARKLCS